MTVIYSNFRDNDTLALSDIWANIPNVNVIEITRDTENFEDIVNNAIVQESDTILFCGHGTSRGLLHPNCKDYLLHELNYNLVQAKNVIGIWCWASSFARMVNMQGFFSSMYISNIDEAYRYGFTEAIATDIENSLSVFVGRINQLLMDSTPISEWVNRLHGDMDRNSLIEVYNYNGLSFFK